MPEPRRSDLQRKANAERRRPAARRWFLDHKAEFDAMDAAGAFADSPAPGARLPHAEALACR